VYYLHRTSRRSPKPLAPGKSKVRRSVGCTFLSTRKKVAFTDRTHSWSRFKQHWHWVQKLAFKELQRVKTKKTVDPIPEFTNDPIPEIHKFNQ